MFPLRQSTAGQEIPLGYFLDTTDADTEETGLTIANTDIKLHKAGATTLANKNSGGATHISNGIYYAVLDATDTDTVGALVIFCHVAGALVVRLECTVHTAKVYDSLFAGTDNLEVDQVQLGGDTQSATDLKDFADAGYDPTTNKVQGVVLADTVTDLTNTPSDSSGVTTLLSRLTAARAQVLSDWINAGRLDAILDLIAADVINIDGAAMRGTDSAYTGTPPTAAAIVNEWETQSQADPTGFHVNVLEVAGTGQTANDHGADLNSLIAQVGTAGAGLTNINLPNQTMNITGNLSGSVGSVTGDVTTDAASRTASKADVSALPTFAEIFTTQLTESYSADGAAPTPAQALFAIQQMLQEITIVGKTMTIKKVDGSTTAFTLTLDAVPPTSITRAT